MFKYRNVNSEDIDIICSFPQDENELFFLFPKASFPLTKEQLIQSINTRKESTVIINENDDILGFANYIEVVEDDFCSIGNVIVNPSYRGVGVGTFLINTMIKIGIDKYNIKKVLINCYSKNTKGLLLYSKLGFKPISIEKRYKKGEPRAIIKLEKIISKDKNI